MVQAKTPNILNIQFRRGTVKWVKKGYEKRISELVNNLNETGLVVEDTYFAKSSDSVYITFTLDERNEKRLGLTGLHYVGQIVISGHSRFFPHSTKSFITVNYDDMEDLEKGIKIHIDNMLATRQNVEDYVVIVTEKELTVLQVINQSIRNNIQIEVEADRYKFDHGDVHFTTLHHSYLGNTNDRATREYIRTLRYKGVIHAVAGGKDGRQRLTLTGAGTQLLTQYGMVPPDAAWTLYYNRKTLDLWKTQEDDAEPEVGEGTLSYTPTQEELDELNIDLAWLTAFDVLHEELVNSHTFPHDSRNAWVNLLIDKMNDWLPDEDEVIAGVIYTSKNRGSFHLARDIEGKVGFHQMILHPYGNHTQKGKTVSFFGSNSVETLRNIKNTITDIVTEEVDMFYVTEEDLKLYMTLRQVERYNVGVCTNRNNVFHYEELKENPTAMKVYLARAVNRKTIVSKEVSHPIMKDILGLFSKFNHLGIWMYTLLDNQDNRSRYHTSPTSDRIFKLAKQYMPYVLDNVYLQDNECVPILQNFEEGWLTFIKPSEILSF